MPLFPSFFKTRLGKETNAIYWLLLVLLFGTLQSCTNNPTSMLFNPDKAPILRVTKDKIGIGLVYVNLNHTLPLYESENDSIALDSLLFVPIKKGAEKGKLDFQTPKLRVRLVPYDMYMGDSDKEAEEHQQMGLIHFAAYLQFRVIEKTPRGMTIVFNESTGETCFIRLQESNNIRSSKKDEVSFFDPNFIESSNPNWYYFEYWEQALLRAFYVGLAEGEPLYVQPDADKMASASVESLFRVLEVKGDWARISNEQFLKVGEQALDCWVKWKVQDQVRLQIVLNGGYE